MVVLYIRGCVNCAGFPEAGAVCLQEEGPSHLGPNPCQNDADSQVSAWQPHPYSTSILCISSTCDPPSSIWTTSTNDSTTYSRLAGSPSRVHARPAAARTEGSFEAHSSAQRRGDAFASRRLFRLWPGS